jgi:MFS family permease
VGISGLFPRFVYENPAHRASLSALIWGFTGATGYLLLSGILLGGGIFAAWQWPERWVVFLSVGIGLFVLLSIAACILPLIAARARLEAYIGEE